MYYKIYVIVEWKSVDVIGLGDYNRQQHYCDGVDVIDDVLYI
jgi:hypothetical protein